MTHDEIIKRAANSKEIDLTGYINYFHGGYDTEPSALLVLDPPMGEIVCLELLELMEALAGKNLNIKITVLPTQTTK